MKKLLFPLALLFTMVCMANPVDVNEKVLKAFNSSFANAKNVSWHETNSIFTARFKCNGIDTQIRYDKEGNMLQTIRYYEEQQLAPFISSKVKAEFKGKSIYGITELSTGSTMDYFIVLQDAKHWVTVKSDAFGNLTVHDKMRKG